MVISWFEMIRNNQYVINHVDLSHDNVAQVYYKNLYSEGSTQTSVIHAAFVTTHARLKLYSELDKIGDRVLYFDTDSIIYVDQQGKYSPLLGNYLGELTDELDEGDYITQFVSAGPKNYAYTTSKGKAMCTVKGFTQTFSTKEKINFDSIKNIVTKDREGSIQVPQMIFVRDKKNWTISTEVRNKKYGFVYNKRKLIYDNLTTLPFGY